VGTRPIIKREIAALVDDGIPYIQVDEPRYSLLRRSQVAPALARLRGRPRPDVDEAIAADNSCLEGVAAEGLIVAMHIAAQ